MRFKQFMFLNMFQSILEITFKVYPVFQLHKCIEVPVKL